MSEYRINQITNQAGTAGPQVAGITTFSSSSGLVMPRGDTFRRYVQESIVTDGLVLYLDAGNKISYPSTGTIWTDLSGNSNNGTLINGIPFNTQNQGSLVFEGIDDYVSVPYNASLPYGSSPRTVSIWFYSTESTWALDTNTLFHYGFPNTRLSFGLDFDVYPKFQLFTWSDDLTYESKLNKIGWNNITATYDGNLTISLYDNSLFTASKVLGGILDTSINYPISIGAIPALSSYFEGRIGHISIYRKMLNFEEIRQNYNALKGRFGL